MPLRTLLVAALAAAGLAVPPAHAAQGSQVSGDCGFNAVNQETLTGPDDWRGEVYLYAVLTHPDPAAGPVSASVTCYVMVDGVPQPGTRITMPATGAVAAAGVVRYQAREDQWVDLCMEVDFLSDDTPTEYIGCGSMTPPQLPPQEIVDLVNEVFDTVDEVMIQVVDPFVCPGLGAHAGTYGPVTVTQGGDVYVGTDLYWDCPPYEGW